MLVARLPSCSAAMLQGLGALAALFVSQCPGAEAAPADVCVQLGGQWSVGEQFCGKVVVNANQTKTVLEARYPADLVERGACGSALRKYLEDFIARFSEADDDPNAADGGATLRYRQFEHRPALRSVLFSNMYYTDGAARPVEELTSFTFDAATGRALAVADLFQSGERALSDLARLARPAVQSQLEPVNEFRARENQPPLRAEDFDPGGPLNRNSYPVYVVSADELVLSMPQLRSGEAGSAMVEAHVPLSSLREMLRPQYR